MKKLIYVGRRMNGEHLHSCFMLGKKEYFWGRTRWARIGDLYKCSDDFKMHRLPESLGRAKVTDEQIETWKLLDDAARDAFKDRRAFKKVDKAELWHKTISDLSAMYDKAGYEEKNALVKRITKLVTWGRK